MRRRERVGFTLMEVTVALALAGALLLGASGLVDAIGRHASTLLAASRSADAARNADHYLRRAVADIVLATDTSASLVGTADAMRFTSWCNAPSGWQERCEHNIEIRRTASGARVVMHDAWGERPLGTGLQVATLRYLESADAGGLWRERWAGTVMLPAAIAIVRDGDTLLAPIGDRR